MMGLLLAFVCALLCHVVPGGQLTTASDTPSSPLVPPVKKQQVEEKTQSIWDHVVAKRNTFLTFPYRDAKPTIWRDNLTHNQQVQFYVTPIAELLVESLRCRYSPIKESTSLTFKSAPTSAAHPCAQFLLHTTHIFCRCAQNKWNFQKEIKNKTTTKNFVLFICFFLCRVETYMYIIHAK